MFKAYDTESFGEYMRSVRKALNLTQLEVENKSSVNIETLRRLEQGKVIPKYETIEFLSRVYKQDLLLVFGIHRTSQIMYEFYDYLDEIIINYDTAKIQAIEEKFETVLENKELLKIIDRDQVVQLQILIEGITKFYNKDYDKALELFIKGIKITNKEFNLDNYKKHKYDLLEARIMLLIALCHSGLRKISLSINIMLLVMKQLNNSQFLTENHIKLIVKLTFNISYNYYIVNDLKKSFTYAEKGIKFCKQHNSSYLLFALYYRRGVTKLLMGKKNYGDDFRFCITLLEIEGKKDLIKVYRKSTLRTHKIKI